MRAKHFPKPLEENAGDDVTFFTPVTAWDKRLNHQTRGVFKILFLLAMLVFPFLGISQSVTITAGPNPDLIVPMSSQSATFTLTIKNSSKTTALSSGAYRLQVDFPTSPGGMWSVDSIWSIGGNSKAGKGATGMIINEVIPANGSIDIKVNLLPLCNLVNNHQITYNVLPVSGSNIIGSGLTPAIVSVQNPSFSFTSPHSRYSDIGKSNRLIWELKETNPYVTEDHIMVEINCREEVLEMTRVELVWLQADAMSGATMKVDVLYNGSDTNDIHFTAANDTIRYTLDSTIFKLQKDGKTTLSGNEPLFIREFVTLKKCSNIDSSTLVYDIFTGNGTDWCHKIGKGQGAMATFTVQPKSYAADITNFQKIVYPTSPTNDGFLFLKLSNTSKDTTVWLKNAGLAVWASDLAQYNFKDPILGTLRANGEFISLVDTAVNRGLPPSVVVPTIHWDTGDPLPPSTQYPNGLSGNSKLWIGYIDSLTVAQIQFMYPGTTLEPGRDKYSPDLRQSTNVYVKVPWNVDWTVHNPTSGNCSNNAQILNPATIHSQILYSDVCGNRQAFERGLAQNETSDTLSTNRSLGQGINSDGGTFTALMTPANIDTAVLTPVVISISNTGISPDLISGGWAAKDTANMKYFANICLPKGFTFQNGTDQIWADMDNLVMGNTIPAYPVNSPIPSEMITVSGSIETGLCLRVETPGAASRIYNGMVAGGKYYIRCRIEPSRSHNNVVPAKSITIGNSVVRKSDNQEMFYGCATLKDMNFSIMSKAQGMQMISADVTRTTLGYTEDLSTRLTSINGINARMAGPYDNMVLTSNVKYDGLDKTKDLIFEFKYAAIDAEGECETCYYFETDSSKATNLYGQTLSGTTVTQTKGLSTIKIGANTYTIPNGAAQKIYDPVTKTHTIKVTLPAATLNTWTLRTTDTIKLALKLQTTLNPLPSTIRSFPMETIHVYSNNPATHDSTKNTMSISTVVVDYMQAFKFEDANNGRYIQTNKKYNDISIAAFQSDHDVWPADREFFTNENRPNQWLRSFDIRSSEILGMDQGNLYFGKEGAALSTGEFFYNASAANCGTTLLLGREISGDFNEFGNLMNKGGAYESKGGIYDNGVAKDFYFSQYKGSSSLNKRVTLNRQLYTSSEKPVIMNNETYNNVPFNLQVQDYIYDISSPQPVQIAKGTNVVEWDVTIHNTSSWLDDDNVLPNAWFGVKDNYGQVISMQLIDQNTGNVVGSFQEEGSSTPKKYVIKNGQGGLTNILDNLAVESVQRDEAGNQIGGLTNGTRTFTLRLTFNSCESQFSDYLYFGTSFGTFVGFTDCAEKDSVLLTFIPEPLEYIVKFDSIPGADANGEYDFCGHHPFTIELTNTSNVAAHDVKVTFLIEPGQTWVQDSSIVITDTKGHHYDLLAPKGSPSIVNGYPGIGGKVTPQPNATNPTQLEVSFGPDFALSPYMRDSLWRVNFLIYAKVTCDFRQGSNSNVIISASKRKADGTLCDPITQRTGSAPIYIAGLPEMKDTADIKITGLELNSTVIFNKDTATATKPFTIDLKDAADFTANKVLNVTGQFTYGLGQAPDVFAYIDFPTMMKFNSGSMQAYDKTGTTTINGPISFVEYDAGGIVTRYRASFPESPDDSTIFKFNIQLELKDPALASCDNNQIYLMAGKAFKMGCPNRDTCDIRTPSDFKQLYYAYDKNNISNIYLNNLTLTGKYKNDSTETVTVGGNIRNLNLTEALNDLLIEVYTDTTHYYQLLPRVDVPANSTVNIADLAGNPFSFDVPAKDVCHLRFVVNSDSNVFICQSAEYHPSVGYALAKGLDSICQGETLRIGDSLIKGYTYRWSAFSTADSSYLSRLDTAQVNFTYPDVPAIAPTDPINYRLTLDRGTGCPITFTTMRVKVQAEPIFTLRDTITACQGGVANLMNGVASVQYAVADSIKFSRNYGFTDFSNIVNNTLTNVPLGNTPIYVKIMNAAGCASVIDTFMVKAEAPPTANWTSLSTSLCNSDSTVFSVNITGRAPWKLVYEVKDPNNATQQTTINIPTGASPQVVNIKVKPTIVGTYTYTLISIQDTNCSGTITGTNPITVELKPLPTASWLVADDSLCVGGNVVFDLTLGGTSGPWTVYYKQNGVSNSAVYSDVNSVLTIPSLSIGTYTFVLDSIKDNTTTCKTFINSPATTVSIFAIPTVTTTANKDSVCSDANVRINWQSQFGIAAVDGDSLAFYSDLVATTPVDTANYIVTAGTMATVYVKAVNKITGCITAVPTMLTFKVNTLLKPTINGDMSVCETSQGLGVQYATGTTMKNYTWSITGGTIASYPGANTDSSYITVNWAAAGTGHVKVFYTDPLTGCVSSTTDSSVTINPIPTPTVTGNRVVCGGNQAIVYKTNAGMTDYSWALVKVSDSTVASTAGTFVDPPLTTADSVIVNWGNTPDSVYLRVTYKSPAGCNSDTTYYRVDIQNPLKPVFETSDDNVCFDQTVRYSTQTGYTNYKWTYTNGTQVQGGGTGDNYIELTWNGTTGTDAGKVWVTYDGGSGCGSVDTAKVNVTVNSLPTVNVTLTGKDTAVCASGDVTFNLTQMVDNITDSLVFSKSRTFSNPITGITTYTVVNNTTDTLYVKAVNRTTGCETPATAYDSLRITVNPNPRVTVRATAKDTAVCSDITVTFDLTTMVTQTNGNTLQFNTTKDFSAANITTPGSYDVLSGSTSKVYVRSHSTVTGCTGVAIDSITMTVNDLPNVTAQFGDGTQDTVLCSSNLSEKFNLTNWVIVSSGTAQYRQIKNGVVTTVATPSAHIVTAGTTDTIYVYSINSVTGCATPAMEYDTIRIRVNPNPTVTVRATAKDTAVCSDITVTFDLTTMVTQTNGNTLQFNTTKDFSIANITTPTSYDVSSGTTSKVYVRGYNSVSGCTGTAIDSIKITVNDLPDVTAQFGDGTQDTVLCSSNLSEKFNLTNWVIVSSGTAQYRQIKNGVVTTVATPSAHIVAAGTTDTIYAYSINSTTGCATPMSEYDTIRIRVNPNPRVTVRATAKDTAVCSDITVTFDLTTMVTQTNGNTLQFNTTKDFSAANITTPGSYDVSSGTTSKVYVRGYNSVSGCTGTAIDSIKITVNDLPNVTAQFGDGTQDTVLCSSNLSEKFNLTNWVIVSSGTAQYRQIKNGVVTTVATPSAHIVAAGTTDTIYVYSINGTTGCATPASEYDTLHITVNPFPVVATRATARDTSVCSDQTVSFDLPSMIGTQTNGDALEFCLDKTFGSLINPVTAYQVAVGNTSKVYVRLVNTTTGCATPTANIDSIRMTVNGLPTVNVTLIGKDTAVCSSTAVTFDLTQMVNNTTDSLVFSKSRTFSNPITGITATTAYTVVNNTTDTLYVKAVNKTIGCETPASEYDTLRIRVNGLPTVTVNVIGRDTSVCSDATVSFDLKSMVTMSSGDSLQFSETNNFATLIPNANNYTVAVNADSTVYLRALNLSTGCFTGNSAIDSIKLHVRSLPDVHVTLNGGLKDTAVCASDEVSFDLTQMVNNVTDSLVFSKSNMFNNPITEITDYTVANNGITDTLYVKAVNRITGCETPASEYDTLRIRVNENPTVSVLLTDKDTAVCSNTALDFNLDAMVQHTGNMLEFNTSKTFAAATQVASPVNVMPDYDTLIYVRSVTTATGCAGTQIDSISISVYSLPSISPNAGFVNTLCPRTTSPYNALFNVRNAVASYTGDTILFSTQSGSNFDANILPVTDLASYAVDSNTTKTIYVKSKNNTSGCYSEEGIINLTVRPLSIATLTRIGTGEICGGGDIQFSVDFTGGTAPWTFKYSDNGISNTITTSTNPYNLVITAPAVGTHSYTMDSLGDATCQGIVTNSANIDVTVNPTPVADFMSIQGAGLVYSFANMSNITPVSTMSYEWNFGDTASLNNTSTLQNPAHAFSSTGTFDVMLITTSDKGCLDTAMKSVDLSSTGTISGTNAICVGDSVPVTISLDPNSVGPWTVTLKANGDSLTTITFDQNPYVFNVSPSTTTVYSIDSVIDNYGSTGVVNGNATITVNPIPDVNITGDSVLCLGQDIQLYGNPTGAGGSWKSLNNAVASINADGVVKGWTEGSADIVYTYVNQFGCSNEDTAKVKVVSVPEVTVYPVGAYTTIATIATVDVTDNNPNKPAGVSYHVADSSVASVSYANGQFTITGKKKGNTEIIYTSVNAAGCSTEVIIPIQIEGTPTGILTGKDIIKCNVSGGDTTIVQIAYIMGGVAPWKVTVSDDRGTFSKDTIINSLDDLPVNMEVIIPENQSNPATPEFTTYVISNVVDSLGANKQTNYGFVRIGTNPTPKINIVANKTQTVCAGQATLPVSFAGVSTIFRTFVNKNIGTINYSEDGIESFVARISNNNNQTDTATIIVTPEYWYNGVVCYGNPDTATIIVVPVDTADFSTRLDSIGKITFTGIPSTATSYVWNFGDGKTGTGLEPAHTYTQSGTYAVTLKITNSNGCTSTITKQVSVSTTTDLEAKFNVNQAAQCLNGNSYKFFDLSRITTQNHSISSWKWYFGDGDSSSVQSPVHVYDSAATYEVRLVVTEAPGNTQSSYSQTITVITKPVITITAPAAICNGGTLTLPNPTIDWKGNTPTIGTWLLDSNVFNPNHSLSIADSGKVLTYQVITSCGDTVSNEVKVVVNSKPQIGTITDKVYCASTQISRIVLGSMQGVTYQWKQTGNNIGLSSMTGTDSIPGFTTINEGLQPLTARFEVTAENETCKGNTIYFNITVNPRAKLTSAKTLDSLCSGSRFDYEATANLQGIYFQWERVASIGINNNLPASSSGYKISEILTNTTSNPVEVLYVITLGYGECTNFKDTVKVVVKPLASISLAQESKICKGEREVAVVCANNTPNIPVYYQINFSAKAIEAGFRNVSNYTLLTNDTIRVSIPEEITPQSYWGTVKIQSSGCESKETYDFIVKVVDEPKITEHPQREVIVCENNMSINLSVTATGGDLEYHWYFNGQPIAGATQSVYTDNDVTASDFGHYNVIVSNMCGVVISESSFVRENEVKIGTKWDDVLFVYGADTNGNSHQYVKYQWYKANPSGEMIAISHEGDAQSYLDPNKFGGTYQVSVTYTDGRTKISCPFTITPSTTKSFKLYPNPAVANEPISIILENMIDFASSKVEVYDVLGKRWLSQQIDGTTTKINLNAPAGTYMVYIIDDKGNKVTQKIVVR